MKVLVSTELILDCKFNYIGQEIVALKLPWYFTITTGIYQGGVLTLLAGVAGTINHQAKLNPRAMGLKTIVCTRLN